LGTDGTAGLAGRALSGVSAATVAGVASTLAGGGQVGIGTLAAGFLGVFYAAGGEHITAPKTRSSVESTTTRGADVVDQTHPPTVPAHTPPHAAANTNDGAPQAQPATQPAPAAHTAAAAGDHSTHAVAHGLPAQADPGAQSSVPSTTGQHGRDHTEMADPHPSPSQAPPQAGSERSAAMSDPTVPPPTARQPGIDPPPSSTVGSPTPEGNLPRSAPVTNGPTVAPHSPPVPAVAEQPGPVSLPATTPDIPRADIPDPRSTPPTISDRATNAAPTPTPDTRAGLAESRSATAELTQPAASAAAPSLATTTHVDPRTRLGDLDRVEEAAHPGETVVQRQAQPSELDPAAIGHTARFGAHLLGCGEETRVDTGRPADLLSTRRDRARPDSTRDDTNRPHGARPRTLPRRSNVARAVPDDLQPATATRGQAPLMAAEDIGIMKASHHDTRPNPGEP
jgi:hypothetical protein